MQSLAMPRLAMTGAPSRAIRRGSHVVMMVVLALAAALVATLFIAPPEKAQAASGFGIERINNASGCGIRIVAVPGDIVDLRTSAKVASLMGASTELGPNKQLIITPRTAPCPGGDHRRVLASAAKTFVGLAVGIAIGLATSVALPEMIIGGFAELGITLGRPLAVAAAQCIGWGLGALAGELIGGSGLKTSVGAAALSCVLGAIGGYVKELDKVRAFFTELGRKFVRGTGSFVQIASAGAVRAGQQLAGTGLPANIVQVTEVRNAMAVAAIAIR